MNYWGFKILDYIDRLAKLVLERMAQNDRNKLENDPVQWFDDHFDGGLRDDNDKAETNKTDDRPDKG
jgi:hypothetical protein